MRLNLCPSSLCCLNFPDAEWDRKRLSSTFRLPHKWGKVTYHVLRDHKPYSDLGADYFDSLDKERLARQSISLYYRTHGTIGCLIWMSLETRALYL